MGHSRFALAGEKVRRLVTGIERGINRERLENRGEGRELRHATNRKRVGVAAGYEAITLAGARQFRGNLGNLIAAMSVSARGVEMKVCNGERRARGGAKCRYLNVLLRRLWAGVHPLKTR